MQDNTDNTLQVLEAGLCDISVLTSHHCAMFQEMWERKGQQLSSTELDKLKEAYMQKLKDQVPAGVCKGWIIKAGDQVAASGAITICSFVPTPIDPSQNIAYLHSVYTKKGFRGKGLVNLLLKAPFNIANLLD